VKHAEEAMMAVFILIGLLSVAAICGFYFPASFRDTV
jgi:hypothetical protein